MRGQVVTEVSGIHPLGNMSEHYTSQSVGCFTCTNDPFDLLVERDEKSMDLEIYPQCNMDVCNKWNCLVFGALMKM